MKVSSTDKLTGIIGTFSGIAMYWYAGTFPKRAASAARYIRFLAIVFAIFSVLVLFRSLRVKNDKKITWIESPMNFYFTAGLLILYVSLLNILGFFVSSFLFMMGLSWILGYRKILTLSAGTVSLLLVIYFVFGKFLSVPVPSGIF